MSTPRSRASGASWRTPRRHGRCPAPRRSGGRGAVLRRHHHSGDRTGRMDDRRATGGRRGRSGDRAGHRLPPRARPRDPVGHRDLDVDLGPRRHPRPRPAGAGTDAHDRHGAVRQDRHAHPGQPCGDRCGCRTRVRPRCGAAARCGGGGDERAPDREGGRRRGDGHRHTAHSDGVGVAGGARCPWPGRRPRTSPSAGRPCSRSSGWRCRRRSTGRSRPGATAAARSCTW